MDIDSPFRPAATAACFSEIYRCQPASALSSSNPLRHTLDFCGKSNTTGFLKFAYFNPFILFEI